MPQTPKSPKPKLFINVPERSYLTVDADTLVELKQTDGDNVAIVDVRDEDYIGGQFDQQVEQLIKDLEGKSTIVFHCMFSQQRGPNSACVYAEHLHHLNRQQKIFVLSGGFYDFRKRFLNNGDWIVENEAKYWNADGVHTLDVPPFEL